MTRNWDNLALAVLDFLKKSSELDDERKLDLAVAAVSEMFSLTEEERNTLRNNVKEMLRV